jgi:beta-glucanase (GH16 family)
MRMITPHHPRPVAFAGRRALLSAAVATLGAPALADVGDVLDLTGYTESFVEEFDRLDVSARGPGTRWTAQIPWGGQFGAAGFTDPAGDFPFTLREGALRIEARKGPNGRWRSGLLSSVDRQGRGFTQRYGYFEIRALLPRGEAVWPAFWLIGADRLASGSRYTAEVDILEHYGNQPDRYSTSVHVWDRVEPDKHRSVTQRVPAAGNMLQDRHNTFGALIEEEQIRFFHNRREAWRTPTPPQHRQPMFLLVNLALRNNVPLDAQPSPTFMHVDYVRAWSPRS